MIPSARIFTVVFVFFLFGIAPAAAAEQWSGVDFAPGWAHYDNGYRPVSAIKSGNVVTLSGLAKRTRGAKKRDTVAVLPAGMRPRGTLTFNVSTHERAARVDVTRDGRITLVDGALQYGWVSLDGISFSLSSGNALSLASGWQAYGRHYDSPNAVRAGDTVMLGGMIRPVGAKGLIAALPGHLRPAHRHIFNVIAGDRTARVDVLPNGQVRHVAGYDKIGWLSLNGITFRRQPGQALKLAGGWRNYGNGYAPASVTRNGNRVIVSGLIKGNKWGHVATLPKDVCPKNRLIFSLNNNERSARVDAIVDCRIYWAAGGRDHGWLSLDGFSYVLKPGGNKKPVAAAPRPGQSQAKQELLSGGRDLAQWAGLGSLWQQWENAFKGNEKLLKADVRIANQRATVVVYLPNGKRKPNIAILTNDLKVGHLIKSVSGTPADDLKVVNAAFIFAPKGNAERIDVNALPGVVRNQVAKVRTGAIDIVSGQNVFSTVATDDNGTTAKFLKLIGTDLGALHVHIGYGRKKVKKKTVPYRSARLTLAKTWNRPFHLKNVSLRKGATFELNKSGRKKTIRGWGMGKVKNKNYFLFLQKTGAKGPYPTAAAVDARSISLKDYKDIALIFGESVFGSVNEVKMILKGIDRVPLDEVRVENTNYRPGGTMTVQDTPKLDNVLLMAAAPRNTLPSGRKGPVLVAHGKGKVFGHEAGKIDAVIDRNGMNAWTKVDLPDWGKIGLGTFDFALYGDKKSRRYAMKLKGKAKLAGVIDETVTIEADNRGFAFALGPRCPLRPVGIKARVNGHDIGSGSGFKISETGGDPLGCVADIAETVKNAPGTVVKVSSKAYSEAEKKTREELKDIGKKAEKAAKWVANKIGGLFGKKKKKPKKPSKEELRKLECAKTTGYYARKVLWNDECRRNWVAKTKFSVSPTVRQSSTQPPGTLKNARFTYEADKARNHLTRIPFVPDAAMTKAENNPWWEVEFPQGRAVNEIVIFRSGFNPVSLKGLVVAVSATVSGDALMTDMSGQVKRYKIDEDSAVVIINTVKKIPLAGRLSYAQPLYVRYMRIYRPGRGNVALGEVWALL